MSWSEGDGRINNAGGAAMPQGTPEQQERAEQQFAQRGAARAEVKKTTKTQIQRMKKGKLIEFIRKAIVAVATSPAQIVAETIRFEQQIMSGTKGALVKFAHELKGMI